MLMGGGGGGGAAAGMWMSECVLAAINCLSFFLSSLRMWLLLACGTGKGLQRV